MSDDTTLARNGTPNPLGKLTAEIPKFKVPEEVKEILEREAHEAGLDLSAFMRELAMVRALGCEQVKSLYADRVDVVVGKREE